VKVDRFTAGLALSLAWSLASPRTSPAGEASSGQNRALEDFRSPPAESRIIKIIHSWPDDAGAQKKLIHSLTNQGFGGVVCNVSLTDYLESDAKWGAFTGAVAAAKAAGLALWLYDEKGYPSAAAGGLVLKKHPEWKAQGLLVAHAETSGEPIKLAIPPGEPFLLAAFPQIRGSIELQRKLDLSDHVRDGRILWHPPNGSWQVVAITRSRLFEGTHASMSLADHLPYPNLLQAEPTARFIELTHQSYAQHLGPDLGKYFISTFTDEPSLISLFLKSMPYRVLPWSLNLPAEFKKRRGYALEPVVAALVTEAGAEGRRARYDYWQTVGELVSENYFGQIQRWCSKHHLRSGGHLLMEENLVNQVPLYGDFFQCLRRLDAPSIDCLTSIPGQVPWFIARLAGSAAELEGKSVTMCETSDHSQRYRPPGDTRPVQVVTAAEIRGTCNRLIVAGIDTITSYYSFDRLSDAQLRELNAYVGRCCASLKGGFQVADVAVLYPTASVWPRFTPSRHYANECSTGLQIESVLHDVSEALFAAGRDFTYIDARTLAEAKVESGALVHGRLRWRVVILPGADTLPLKAWERLAAFVRTGGVLISVGALPSNSEKEFPSRRVVRLGNEIFGRDPGQPMITPNRSGGGGVFLPAGAATFLPRILDAISRPELTIATSNSPLRSTHRRIGSDDVFFIINDSSEPWKGEVSLRAHEVDVCDPNTGRIETGVNASGIDIGLEPYGSVLLRSRGVELPARPTLQASSLPHFVLGDLTNTQPLVARGEFVREDLSGDVPTPGRQTSALTATGTITKSNADTFLFVRFPYPNGCQLGTADALVLSTSVPDTQRTPAQLLLILHEKSGADYLANMGRWLNTPGATQTWVALGRFQLAGWSQDQNQKLDVNEITEIRIGWGGYYGAEGEKVRFTVAAPRIATFR
jgi:hypothetical protein